MSYYKRGGLSRRELLKWATITGTGLALASCGAAATPTTAPAAGGGKPTGAINYWHHFTSDSEMKGLEKITANFKVKYPEVTLTQENIPNKDYMAKFTSAVQANTRPDTAMVSADRVVDMVAMNGLTDLTARINAWDGKKDFPDNRWTLGTINGKIYGIPGFMFVNWLYYRPDFFQEAGISGPPKTWAEFGDAAIKLTNTSKNRFGFGMRGGDGGEGFVLTVFRAWGSSLVDDKGKPAIDAAKATEALKFYVELFTKHKASPSSAPSDSYAQIMNAFKTGQTAMVMHHTGSLKEIKDALGDKFATAPMPAGPVARIADVTPLYNGIMKNDKIDAAWAWVTQWGQADSSIALLEETGYFPASTSVAADKRITENPIYKAAIETLGYGTQAPQFNGNAAWQKQTVLPAFQKALLGQATPEQAVNEMIEGLKKATA